MSGGGDEPISVVVATRDRPGHLRACLDALAGSVDAADEIVVVDSCSRDDETTAVAEAAGVRVVRCERPGASLARNTGWRAARHDLVAFVDDDVRVLPSWARAVRSVFAADPELSFATGRLGLSAHDSDTEYPIAFIDDEEPRAIDRTTVHHLGHGANLVIRRAALKAVGGYAEALGPGAPWRAGEDLELIDRLVGAGLRGAYRPEIAATHEQWRDRRAKLRLEWNYGIGEGARLVTLWRRDRARARLVTGASVWDGGVVQVARCVRQRYEFAAAAYLIRLVGMVGGAVTFAASAAIGGAATRRRPTAAA